MQKSLNLTTTDSGRQSRIHIFWLLGKSAAAISGAGVS